jgi:hypothetical protein
VTADELYQIHSVKNKRNTEKDKKKSADELYSKYSVTKNAQREAETSAKRKEEETPHSTVDFRSRFTSMMPNASIIDSQLNANANAQERKTQNYINSSPSVAVAPKSQTKYPAIEAEYQKKKTDIASGKQEQSVKDSYLAEAQLEREVKMLEERARNQAIIDKGIPGVTIPQKSAFNNGRTSAIQNTDSEELTKAKELLETKRAELKQIQESNKLNRALDDPELSQELETMFFNRADAQASEKYGKTLTAKGYDATEMLKQYTELKDKEAVEILKQLTLKHPDLSAEDFANEKYDEVKQLRWLGYTDPIELFDIYKRYISKETTEMVSDKVSEFASKNPASAALATGASFVTNLGKGAGSFAVSNPYVDRVRGTDENSLAFLPSVATETARNTVSSYLTENQKKVYNLGTTIGDMIITQAAASVMGSSSVIGYSYLMASQAAGESARESVQKGYSPEHASVNAALTTTIVTASSALGYDKIFKSTSATTFNSYVRNLLMNFMSEGAEETSEEVLTDIATSITNACYGKDGIITERAKQLMQDGMTEEEAVASAVIERISELSETFIVSGLAGGIISAATSLPEYSSSVVERQLNKKLKTPETDIQPPTTDVQNELNLPSETEVETTPQTVPTTPQNAENQAISTDTDSVSTTVDENGVEWINFDDDTDFEAVNEELKEEYNAEETAGLAEKVEPYTSGNSSVDALINPNGRLDRKITIDEQAQQRIIDIGQRFFGRKVKFVDDISNANGFFDPDTGEIVLSKTSSMKELTLFGHEFAHTLEGTNEYHYLTTHLRYNSQYIKSQLAKANNSWDELVQQKINDYQSSLGKTLTKSQAEFEIYADTIANELFTNYKAIEVLATQNQSLFTRLKQWFYRDVIKTSEQTTVLGTKAAQQKTYALMLQAEKAAMNKANGTGKKFMLSPSFSSEFDLWVKNGAKDPRKIFDIGRTSKALKSVGLADKPITWDSKKIITIMREHPEMNTEILKSVPKILENPIVIMKSKQKESRLTMFGEVVSDGKPVLAVLELSPKDRQGFVLDEFKVVSSYGKDNAQTFLNSSNIIYREADKKRISEWEKRTGLQLPVGDSNADSTDSISDFAENVNNKSYSAKQPETAQRITENFGYTDATANNIVKAARTLKQKAGSKADTNELAYTIAQTLEDRQNGNTNGRDAELIAMMLAENTEAVNEDFVAEHKPIIDRLNGMTISISEADISDLGDAFSYVKKRLFPYVTLTKGEGTRVDSIFQDLAKDYPMVFNAEAVTHPGDQVKAIMGFIEDYRNNRYFKPYFESDEAFANLREDVETLLGDKTLDENTYLNKLSQLVEKYGEIKNGVPQSTDGKTRIRGAIASFYGTKPIISNPELSARYAKDIVNGKYDYDVMRIGKEAKQYLDNIKSSENVTEKVINEYGRLKDLLTNKNHRLTPTDIMQACALNPLLGEVLTDDAYVDYTSIVAEIGTGAGQILNSFKLISQFSGAQKLKAIQKKVDRINQKESRQSQEDIETNAVVDENGQFETKDKKKPKGVYEFIIDKKKAKYPPIEIPADLQEKLRKAKGQKAIEKASKDIEKYVMEQMHASWFDKFNAWRYLAMLSNPKTSIRNTVGNVAMMGASRIKDVVAAGVSKLPVARKYKDSSVQTNAVITTKEARNAAKRLMIEDGTITRLFSKQDKYTGRLSEFEEEKMPLNKAEQKLADKSPMLGLILNNRTVRETSLTDINIPFTHIKIPFVGEALGKASQINQKMLDDTPYKIIRAKSVLSQSITAALNSGEIANTDDFVAVALRQNTDHLDNATKDKYTQLYDRFCQQAAKEGDESTFRDDNALADKINKLRQGNRIQDKIGAVLVDGFIPFVKTPANIVKRGVEYSPIGLGKAAFVDRYKLAKGNIDRNAYINNLAKGLTGTSIFALGALLSSLGVLSVGDDDEEDEAERKLLNGQEYAIDFGDSSYSIEFLTPAALPLFMGGKVYETIANMTEGDEVKAGELFFDILQGIAEPMFAQTMLSGVDGAFEAVSRETRFNDDEGASAIAVLNYCTENWINQFMPSVLGAVARTADDTQRGYFTEKGKEEGILQDLMVGLQKKTPWTIGKTPAKLDMWGQPIKSGNIYERFIENFISPGYYEEETKDKATLALHEFADDNDIPYTDIIPEKPDNYFTLPNKTQINLTAEEYEKYASIIGRARKEAVEKYLVRGKNVEVEYNYTKIKSSLKSGRTTEKRTFRGNIATATNRYGWAPTSSAKGYIQFDDKGKAVGVTAASDKEFRKMLFDEVMKQATDKAEAEAQEAIIKARNNK